MSLETENMYTCLEATVYEYIFSYIEQIALQMKSLHKFHLDYFKLAHTILKYIISQKSISDIDLVITHDVCDSICNTRFEDVFQPLANDEITLNLRNTLSNYNSHVYKPHPQLSSMTLQKLVDRQMSIIHEFIIMDYICAHTVKKAIRNYILDYIIYLDFINGVQDLNVGIAIDNTCEYFFAQNANLHLLLSTKCNFTNDNIPHLVKKLNNPKGLTLCDNMIMANEDLRDTLTEYNVYKHQSKDKTLVDIQLSIVYQCVINEVTRMLAENTQ